MKRRKKRKKEEKEGGGRNYKMKKEPHTKSAQSASKASIFRCCSVSSGLSDAINFSSAA